MPVRDRLWRWLPVAAWMSVTFCASTDAFSGSHTSLYFIPLLRWLSRGQLSMDAMENIHFLIRKCAHLTEYAVLGVLVGRALNGAGRIRDAGLALLICFLYAASDEFHQSFVPSRTSSVRDVAIDTAGAMIGLSIIAFARRRRRAVEAQAGPG